MRTRKLGGVGGGAAGFPSKTQCKKDIVYMQRFFCLFFFFNFFWYLFYFAVVKSVCMGRVGSNNMSWK